MKGRVIGLAAFLFVISSVSLVHAQRGRMMMGNYDPKTEVTLKGTVEKVEHLTYGNMRGPGLHLIVRTENELDDIHLGPATYIETKMTFKEGDTVKIVASEVTMMGKTAFIAREITKGDTVLKLRDERGIPLWSGRHQGVGRIS